MNEPRKYAAQTRYDAANTIMIAVKFNRRTDADIIDRLNKEPNRQGYIKKLIRSDIKKEP